MLVDFESAVIDKFGNRLLEGVYVNFHLAQGAENVSKGGGGPLPFYTLVEKALERVGGVRGSYLCLMMNPVNDLQLDFNIDMMREEDRDAFVTHHLRLHLRQQANAIRKQQAAAKGKGGKGGGEVHEVDGAAADSADGDGVLHEENEDGVELDSDAIEKETKLAGLPTMMLCKIDNVVHINLETGSGQMFVNPNVPVSDWFRCANQILADQNSEERLVPYVKQACSNDVVYSAVCCTVDEQDRWKELSQYGTKMGHDANKVWEVLTNYTVALLRSNAERQVVDITMFKDRILRGVLLGGVGVDEMLKVTKRLDINLL